MDSHWHGAYKAIPQAAAGFSQLEHGKGHESQQHFSKGPLRKNFSICSHPVKGKQTKP